MNNKYLILLCLLIVLILLVLKKNKEDFSLVSIDDTTLKSDGIIGKSGSFSENDLLKEAINNILPELKKKNTHFDNQLLLHSLPKGSIILWGNSDPPKGWVECDGTNGTPNLTDITPICPKSKVKHEKKVSNDGSVKFKLNSNNIPRHYHTASISLPKKSHKHTGTTGGTNLKFIISRAANQGVNSGTWTSAKGSWHCPVKGKNKNSKKGEPHFSTPHTHNFSTKESNMNITATAKINNYGGGKEKTVNIETLPYTYVSFIMKNY